MNKYSYESAGWWMKVAFTTHNLHYRGHSYQTWASVMEELRRIKNTDPPLRDMFPYMMLQPMVPKNKECKVILHNGAPQYFHALANSNRSPKLKTPEAERMFAFAKHARDTLAARCPHANMDGLVRIDIMVLPGDLLVVNEIEGIDSNYSCKNIARQDSTMTFLFNNWLSVVTKLVQTFINK